MTNSIISLKNVTYRYPQASARQSPALDGVDLQIQLGEFVALVGANGSGKSTLARLLNGLIKPAAGEVLIDGLSTTVPGDLDRIRETVGMVFQNPDSQIVATSVEDDIAFGMENLGLPPEEIERRIVESADRFGVSELLGREPHWLSGGQKQRTVLAGVVSLRPRVLVLDEPTAMLDPRSQEELLSLVGHLWQEGTTVIYITHLLEEITEAPRVIALAEGRIDFDGSPRSLFGNHDLLRRTGLAAPLPVRLSTALRERGVDLPTSLTLDELVRSVCVSN